MGDLLRGHYIRRSVRVNKLPAHALILFGGMEWFILILAVARRVGSSMRITDRNLGATHSC